MHIGLSKKSDKITLGSSFWDAFSGLGSGHRFSIDFPLILAPFLDYFGTPNRTNAGSKKRVKKQNGRNSQELPRAGVGGPKESIPGAGLGGGGGGSPSPGVGPAQDQGGCAMGQDPGSRTHDQRGWGMGQDPGPRPEGRGKGQGMTTNTLTPLR